MAMLVAFGLVGSVSAIEVNDNLSIVIEAGNNTFQIYFQIFGIVLIVLKKIQVYLIKLQPFFKERNENFLSTDGISGFIKF